MKDVAAASALVLAAVFVWAAVAKLRERRATVTSFRELRLPCPEVLAVAVPIAEVLLAVALVAAPTQASLVALALVLVFSFVIGRAVAGGWGARCACFGGGAGDRPVSVLELVRNAALGALAIVASGAGAGSALWPSLPALVVVAVVVFAGRLALAVAARA